MQGVAKGHLQLRQFLEVVAHDVLVRHANAAMQLHRLLADKTHGVAKLKFGAGHGLMALGGWGIEFQAGVIAHGAAQLQLHFHVGDTVTQGLEGGDGGVELLARVHVVDGDGHGFVHHAHCFCAHTGNANVNGMAQSCLAIQGHQAGGCLVEGQLGGASAILCHIARSGGTVGAFGDQEQSQFAGCHGGHQKGVSMVTHGHHALGPETCH